VPIAVPPSRKVTVPVGVPLPGTTAPTVAVRVTDWPNREGLVPEASAAEAVALATTWESVGEVLALKLPSPP